MSSPFQAEPMSFDQTPSQTGAPDHPPQQQQQHREADHQQQQRQGGGQQESNEIPEKLRKIIDQYNTFSQNVNEKPDIDAVWTFIQQYFTYLEDEDDKLLPLLQEIYPGIQSNNVVAFLSEVAESKDPCDVFGVLVKLGHEKSNKENRDAKDNYYLIYIMLLLKDQSLLYNFTEYLKHIRSAEEYKILSDRFSKSLDKVKGSKSGPQQQQNSNTGGQFMDLMEKYVDLPVVNQSVRVKWICLFVVVFVLCIAVVYFGYTYLNPGGGSGDSGRGDFKRRQSSLDDIHILGNRGRSHRSDMSSLLSV
jgi:hypothetical protein